MQRLKNINFISFSQNHVFCLSFFIIIIAISEINSYSQSFSITKTPFNSSIADDFAPVFFQNGLVYCSNGLNTSIVSIKSENEALFNMVYVEPKDSGSWKTPVLFSDELTTLLNEGPATFTSDQKHIYYARNIQTEGKLRQINDPSNTLGIYRADYIDGKWSNITSFEYNSELYSVGTPALSADGKRLYFASDMPGSIGGTDLYYCDRIDSTWGKPVNLGPAINTAYNESYPFISQADRLFFASDKPDGFGGKDIYYSLEYQGEWITPIHLDEDINSKEDDFGLITDKNFEWGYFSSNRKSGTNIYYFKTRIPQFDICDNDKPFNKCFDFYDDRFTDTLHLEYEWDFGYGNRLKGIRVQKCFDKPGSYSAVLTIIHHLADCTFYTKFDYDFEISPDKNTIIYPDKDIILNQPVNFHVNQNNNTANSIEYIWNFGQGFKASGEVVQYTFSEIGEHIIKLGAIEKNDQLGTQSKKCTQTRVMVYSDYQHLATEKYICIPYSIHIDRTQEINSNTYLINNYILADFQPRISDSLATSFTVHSGSHLIFDDKGNPISHTKKILKKYLQILKQFPETNLIIAVHQNQKGSQRSNDSETQQIADNIHQYFEAYNIPQHTYECVAYGDSRPRMNRDSKDALFLNKRIEFILLNRYNKDDDKQQIP